MNKMKQSAETIELNPLWGHQDGDCALKTTHEITTNAYERKG